MSESSPSVFSTMEWNMLIRVSPYIGLTAGMDDTVNVTLDVISLAFMAISMWLRESTITPSKRFVKSLTVWVDIITVCSSFTLEAT